MKIKILCIFVVAILFASCGEYNRVLKNPDREVRYEYAKRYFEEKKYGRTITLLESVMTSYVGYAQEQEILFLLAQSYLYDKDYETATAYFRQYYNKFPRGEYAELARFNAPYALYLDSPDVRLDQTNTIKAIQGFQEFLENFPQSDKVPQAQDLMFALQEKLAEKELLAARLYYNLGMYAGNNYEACVVTSREALKNYSFSSFAEEFQILIVRAKAEEANYSVAEKKPTRWREVIDEHFNYMNMFPEGKYVSESTKLYNKATKALGLDTTNSTEETVEEVK
ncbi:outer membrane protein assembly factor BamD [Dysgonomonas massiliensis]|uniref:outer membrane protein assembly factor BamD n=1 Tax=Dysgonomonas massiliensis TaxID=2040292 RepID=UPI000C759C64|nr:outer membrane protein assembly factor BamD [Dysgonomonas massiliensis]